MQLSNENNIKFSVFIIGFTTMITQIILLREFLSIFRGNELIIGIILANWMLLTGLGAWGGRKILIIDNKPLFVFVTHILLGILPLITAFFTYYLRSSLFPPGSFASLMDVFLTSLLLLMPFCLLSGVMFTFFSAQLSALGYSNQISRVYAIDAIGSIVGGLIFNFLLIFIFNAFFSLKVLMIINFGVALYLSYKIRNSIFPRIAGLIAIGFAGAILIFDVNGIALNYVYKNQNIIKQTETPYGKIVVTEMAEQYYIFENTIPVFSTDNTITSEENVHYVMLQHPNPDNVLLISGGYGGAINEVLKYNIKSLDYLEINPSILKLGNKYSQNASNNKKIQVINQDARVFLRNYKKVYDVVIINLPDPVNVQINRYYTLEFFEELKQKLSPSAAISISLTSSANYLNEESQEAHTALFSTLKLIFDNVIVIPGTRNYFIASDGILSSEISRLTRIKKISNTYVNPNYIDDELIQERRQQIEKAIAGKVLINYDFLPLPYLLQLKLWLRNFKIIAIVIGILLFVLLVIIIPRLHIVNVGLFTTGFSASSLEIILLIAFQIFYGYVYFMLGIFITVFMIGLVTGSLIIVKKIQITYKNYSLFQYAVGIIAIIVPIILNTLKMNQPGNFIIHSIFIIFILITGILTGIQFAIGTRLRIETITNTAATAYGSDLLGSAIGALLVVGLFIPLLGIIKVCLLIGILNFIAGLLVLFKSTQAKIS
ncbi:MAG: fused MFS/spermidine synthase [Bacteroidetes bacterium]|nr:fused MFS/spermidine synthase [Bacteroidota bacterium]